jgi:mannose-6-phosphate isomerase-like protein (cupin superfamily)
MINQKPDIDPVIVHERDCALESWDDDIKGRVQWRTLISGDRTATKGLTCGIAELPVGPAKNVSLHQHNPVEIYYILEGNGVLTINDEAYEVSAGVTAYIPENASHGLINAGPTPLRLLYVFPVDSFDEVEYVFPSAPE